MVEICGEGNEKGRKFSQCWLSTAMRRMSNLQILTQVLGFLTENACLRRKDGHNHIFENTENRTQKEESCILVFVVCALLRSE